MRHTSAPPKPSFRYIIPSACVDLRSPTTARRNLHQQLPTVTDTAEILSDYTRPLANLSVLLLTVPASSYSNQSGVHNSLHKIQSDFDISSCD